MKKDLIKFYCYEYTCPPELLQEIKEIALNMKWKNIGYNKGQENKDFDNQNIRSWIDQCLADFKNNEFPNSTFSIKATQIWLNKSQKMELHHRHAHANSVVSGILYLTTVTNGGKTAFYYPNPFWKLHNEGLFSFTETGGRVDTRNEINSEEGKMIIFPSSIEHSVTAVKDNTQRYSLAFNTFISGELGTLDAATYLQLP